MSERGDFFESASKGKQKPLPTRGDFFSGQIDLDDLPAKAEKSREFGSEAARAGFGRGGKAPTQETLDAMRTSELSKAADDPIGTLFAIPTGLNRGVAALPGLPFDVGQNLIDLGGAAYSTIRSQITGEDPNELYQVPDRANVIGTGDWFSQKLDAAMTELGGSPVTQLPADNAIARILYAGASGVPSGLVGGGPLRPQIMSGAAGAGAGASVAEFGGDPSLQATASLLAGHAAARPPQQRAVRPDESPETPVNETQAALNKAASGQSMGAAGAAVDLQKLSPQLKAAVTKAVQETGGAVNPEAMARQVQADSLPVKVALSEGQALADERLISLELNARGKHEIYSKGFAEQNKALTENLRAMRDESGPEVFSTNATEHADTLIGRYKAIHEAADAQTSADYQALRDAAGGAFPIDTPSLLTNVRGALKKDMATSKAPGDVMSFLEEKAAAGVMSLDEYESVRTTLARIQRSSADGQERHAAGVIRRQIEELPLAESAANLKALADKARSSARADFQRQEADPAYKAAVNDLVAPDAFVRKYVVGGTRDNVAKLAEAMAGDDRATQTLKVATLDHLRAAAGIDNGYNGNFTQAGYNKALQSLEPKLLSLLDAKSAETARTLGDVARYTQFQPKGSFANNSNTFVSAAAEKAADALEGIIDFKTGGIPIASQIRKAMNESKVRKQAEKTFAPGAGLTRLSDLTKIGKDKP